MGRKARAILAMLAISPDMRRARAWLQDRLWSEKDQERGRASLRRELSNLRRHFAAHDIKLIEASGEDIVLNPAMVETDLDDKQPAAHHELLEGVDVRDPEFEYWLSDERAHWYTKLSDAPFSDIGKKLKPALEDGPFVASAFRPILRLSPFKIICGTLSGENFRIGLNDEMAAMLSSTIGTFDIVQFDPTNNLHKDLYVLTGTIRLGQRVRVLAQLTQSDTSKLVWSARYEESLDDQQFTQEAIARKVVESVQRVLRDGQGSVIKALSTTSSMAWDEYQRGRAFETMGGRLSLAPSLSHFRRSIYYDPGFYDARVSLAFRLLDGVRNCWIDDEIGALSEIKGIVDEIDPVQSEDPWMDALFAFISCAEGRFEDGLSQMTEVAQKHAPSCEVISCLGAVYEYCGAYGEAVFHHRIALKLSEYPPDWVRSNLATAAMLAGDATAINIAENILEKDGNNLRALMVKALCLGRSGQTQLAREMAESVRRLDPTFSAASWRSLRFFSDRHQHKLIERELTKLGL